MNGTTKRYIGMTIGPIFDTVNLASSPAALWAGSYFFSLLSRNICLLLTERYGVSEEQIISPYYEKDAALLNKNDGIGLFHDRIVFLAEGFDASKTSELKEEAIANTAEFFGLTDGDKLDYLRRYVMIASVEAEVAEGENPILATAVMLDAMELAKPYVFRSEENPILSLFVNHDGSGRNEAIKAVVNGFESFALRASNGKLKDISAIIGSGDYKRYNYYAIVRSDGDNMGKILGALKGAEEIRDFSQKCLSFCSRVADEAIAYGGAPIYAGGDDLLAILPCERNGKTVFEFIQSANGIFADSFKDYPEANASLSFGVTVAYYKFPLYEALAQSADMLFGQAKSVKNCVAFNLQKHSGQSEGLLITNSALETVVNNLNSVMKIKDDTLLSAMHKLGLFKQAFNNTSSAAEIENLFLNTFDADAHEDNNFVRKTLPDLFKFIARGGDSENGRGIYAIDKKGIVKGDPVFTMQSLMRVMKFYVEKGGE